MSVVAGVNVLEVSIGEGGQKGQEELAGDHGDSTIPRDRAVPDLMGDKTGMHIARRDQNQHCQARPQGHVAQQSDVSDPERRCHEGHVTDLTPSDGLEAAGVSQFAAQHAVESVPFGRRHAAAAVSGYAVSSTETDKDAVGP
jgi:hypothetical protein